MVGQLKLHNTTLVAITLQIAQHSAGMRKKHGLDFRILHDPRKDYAAKLGLRAPFSDELKKVYNAFKVDLAKANGNPSRTLLIPTGLLVDQSVIVRVADITPDCTIRPVPKKTLDDVKALG